MSEQTLNIQDDWKRIIEEFRNHFTSKNTQILSDMIKYSGCGEYLKICKNGDISGEMPLHKVELSNVEEVTYENSQIKFKSRRSSYTFKR